MKKHLGLLLLSAWLGLLDTVAFSAPPLKCFAISSGYGCKTLDNAVAVPFQFRSVAIPAKGQTVFVQHKTGFWQGYDLVKKQLVPHKMLVASFSEAPHFVNPKDLSGPVQEAGHIDWQGYIGLVDRTGQLLIPPVYDALGAKGFYPLIGLYQGIPLLLPAFKDGKAGMLDATGQAVVPLMYDDVIQHHPWAHFVVLQQGKYMYLAHTQTGKLILPHAFDWIDTTNPYHGLFAAKYQGKKGLIDVKTFKIVVPFQYTDMGLYVYSGEMGWFLDTQFFDGFIGVKNAAGKWGIINDKNTLVVPYEFDQVVQGTSYDTRDPNVKICQAQAAAARHKLVAFVKTKEQVAGYLDPAGKLHRLQH